MIGKQHVAPLEPLESKCLGFIRAQMEANGVPPSYREIAAFLGINSTSHVLHIIDALVRAGVLARTVGRYRSLQLVQTEDYHLPACACVGCDRARYLAQLKLIQAIQQPAKFARGVKLNGIRPLGNLARLEWSRPRIVTRTEGKRAFKGSAV